MFPHSLKHIRLAVPVLILVLMSMPPTAAAQEPPVLTNNSSLSLDEGSSATITSGFLLVTDADTPAGDITITVTEAPLSGNVLLGGFPVGLLGSFTQADVDAGQVGYEHNGNEGIADSFLFAFDDGTTTVSNNTFDISISPVNDPPILQTNNPLEVGEGFAATISSSHLLVTDADNAASSIEYQIDGLPSNGALKLNGSPLSGGQSFTQAQVNSLLVSYEHSGNETSSDDIVLSVSDGSGGTIPSLVFTISVTPVDDPPILTANTTLPVDEGDQNVSLTSYLVITDVDDPEGEVVITVTSSPTSGTLSSTTFTQQDLSSNAVTYSHSGDETTADSFVFSVTDGTTLLTGNVFSIVVTPVNDNPVLVNSSTEVGEGESTVLDGADLLITDEDNTPLEIQYVLESAPVNGTVSKMGTAMTPGSTFTQLDVDDGLIEYAHSGEKTPSDFFTFSASDGAGGVISASLFDISVTLLPPSADEPSIASIVDVGNDQGRSVLITFSKSGKDTLDSATPVLEYGAFLRLDPLPASLADQLDSPAGAARIDGWVFTGSVPANGEEVYHMLVPTLADSTIAEGMHWSTFFVRALTADPLVYYDSAPDSGYSLDDLAPGTPENFVYSSPGILSWLDVTDMDFSFYAVYASTSETFDESATMIGSTTSPSYDVQSATQYTYFYVTARDFSGNESDAAVAANPNPTGVPNGVPVLIADVSARPNPFNPSTTIAYTVPNAGPVTLTVHSASGRLVATLIDSQYHTPQAYSVHYDPRNRASGIYFVRLRAVGVTHTAKIILLK